MKIRTKLLVSALVPISLLAISTAIQYRVVTVVDRYQHRGLLLGELARGLASLDILILEQRLQSQERAHAQWLEKHRQLGGELDKLTTLMAGEDEHRLLERIKSGFALIGTLDNEYDKSLRQLGNAVEVSPEAVSYAHRLESRLRQELQVITPDAERLYEINRSKIMRFDQRQDMVSMFMIALLGIFGPAFAYLLHRAVAVPISRLHEGIERISGGELAFRLPVTTDDEIGRVSQLFNEMTAQRQQGEMTINLMNEELEQRILSRTEELEVALEHLREAKQKYRVVSDNTYDWEFWLDPDGCFIYTSPSCLRVTGYDAALFYDDPGLLHRVVYVEDRGVFQSHRHDVMEDSRGVAEVSTLLFRIVHSDGSLRWIEHICLPIMDENGVFLGTRGSNRDITDRKLAEDALRLNEIRLQSQVQLSQYQTSSVKDLLDYALTKALRLTASQFGYIYYYDENSRLFTLNAWSHEVMRACSIVNPHTTYSLDETGFWGEAVRQRRAVMLNDFQNEHPLKKGYPEGHAPLDRFLTVPVFCDGNIVAVVGVANKVTPYDMTDELQLALMMDSVWKMVMRIKSEDELHMAKDAAEAASRAKSQFLANMSHEIRTPMNAVLGILHLLQRTDLSARQRDYADKIRAASKSLLAILNDILDFSKVESGKLVLEEACFRLDELLRNLSEMLAASAHDKEVALVFNVADDIPKNLLGDGLRLQQILLNLASNAVKFTEKGSVTVSVSVLNLEAEQARLEFAVKDTGIGIAPDMLDHIFDGFTQAEASTTRRFGGTGLGLAISRQLVELMGGQLMVDSEPGKGSTFCFAVDFTYVHADRDSVPDSGMFPALNKNDDRLAGLRLMVVEDNLINQQVADEILTQEGAAVTVASSGSQALELLTDGKQFDAILMDIQMPEMDGYEATQRIREMPGKEGLPIIAMTANALHADREQCLAAGMNDHVGKPFDVDELVGIIQRSCGLVIEPAVAAPALVRGHSFDRPGFALDMALKRLGDNRNMYASLVRAFETDQGSVMERLRRSLTAGDVAAAVLEMHTLKGVAATLGATELAAVTAAGEKMLKDGGCSTDGMQRMLVGVEQHFAGACSVFRLVADELCPSSGAVDEAVMPDREQLLLRLAELEGLLVGGNLRAMQMYQEVRRLSGTELQEQLVVLDEAIRTLAFPEALLLCRNLREELA